MSISVSGAVEGLVDQAVFERLVGVVHAEPGPLYLTNGKSRLLHRLRGFNEAALRAPWLVLVDLDDAECAPPFRRRHLPRAAPLMVCRVAVRAVEAWLLADRHRISRWLQVSVDLVPARPEQLPDPKQAVVNLARRSRSRDIRQDLVPREQGRRQVGPLYASRLIGFVQDERQGWRPRVAARSSDSLDRCIRHLSGVIATARRKTR